VAYLGELKAAEPDGWAKLGSHLGGEAKARRPQRSLFDLPRPAAAGLLLCGKNSCYN
jgi:hypothetical protein